MTEAFKEKLQVDADEAREASKKAEDKQQRTENRARAALMTRDQRVRGPVKKIQKSACCLMRSASACVWAGRSSLARKGGR